MRSYHRVVVVAMERPATSPDATGVRKEIILLIATDWKERDYIQRLLEGQGFPVVAVETFNDALAMCELLGSEIKLIIVDAVTPGIDNSEIRQAMSSVETELLLLLEKQSDPLLEASPTPPSVPFLHKPIHREELLGRIRQILG